METKTKVRTNWKREAEKLQAQVDSLTAQLAAALEVKDSRREVPELVIAQIVTNRDMANLAAVELRVGDLIVRAPDGAIVTPSKSTVEVDGKRVATSYSVKLGNSRQRFDRNGQVHLTAEAARSFVERAQAVGWTPAEK